MSNRPIRFVSNHRLDREKGWDLIITWLKSPYAQKLIQEGKLEYDIFGDGSLRPEVEKLSEQYPHAIRYHGYTPLQTILASAQDYDFVMMPSRFLETFGLSALDFAQFGVPTIGYKKGGATPFISDNLNISNYPGDTEQEQFNNAMERIVTSYQLGHMPSKLPVTSNINGQGTGNKEQATVFTIDKQIVINTYSTQKRLQRFNQIISK